MKMEQGQWALVEKLATDIVHAEKLIQSLIARFQTLLLSLWKMFNPQNSKYLLKVYNYNVTYSTMIFFSQFTFFSHVREARLETRQLACERIWLGTVSHFWREHCVTAALNSTLVHFNWLFITQVSVAPHVQLFLALELSSILEFADRN